MQGADVNSKTLAANLGRSPGYVAAMKSDLRNLASYEETYAADSGGRYFSGDGSAQGFTPSQNVTITATATTGNLSRHQRRPACARPGLLGFP